MGKLGQADQRTLEDASWDRDAHLGATGSARDPKIDDTQAQARNAQHRNGQGMLDAVSTLFALTPPGRVDELHRLTALAHGFIGFSSEQSIVTLAKAISNRDDVSSGLVDRVLRSNLRAATILIKANRLDERSIDYVIADGSVELKSLVAHHHNLTKDQTTRLIAAGDRRILEALLERRGDPLTVEQVPTPIEAVQETPRETPKASSAEMLSDSDFERADEPSKGPIAEQEEALAGLMDQTGLTVSDRIGPAETAKDFANLDTAARRAVLQRLSQDAQPLSQSDARRMLDPLRSEADLLFLTALERRDGADLAEAFSKQLKLDINLTQQLVDEADGDAYLVLAKAAGISPTAFARIIILSKIGLTGSPRDTFKLVDRFKTLPRATALFVVKSMREGALIEAAEQKRSTSDRPLPKATARGIPQAEPIRAQQQGFRKAV